MKKHETFQQNMYNYLHEELQTFIKGKSPVASEPEPACPLISTEPSTNDSQSMLMARLLAKGDNTETDYVHAL